MRMAQIVVTFTFHSGVKRHLFQNVRLSGSWDANGMVSNQWTQTPMVESQDETVKVLVETEQELPSACPLAYQILLVDRAGADRERIGRANLFSHEEHGR